MKRIRLVKFCTIRAHFLSCCAPVTLACMPSVCVRVYECVCVCLSVCVDVQVCVSLFKPFMKAFNKHIIKIQFDSVFVSLSLSRSSLLQLSLSLSIGLILLFNCGHKRKLLSQTDRHTHTKSQSLAHCGSALIAQAAAAAAGWLRNCTELPECVFVFFSVPSGVTNCDLSTATAAFTFFASPTLIASLAPCNF